MKGILQQAARNYLTNGFGKGTASAVPLTTPQALGGVSPCGPAPERQKSSMRLLAGWKNATPTASLWTASRRRGLPPREPPPRGVCFSVDGLPVEERRFSAA